MTSALHTKSRDDALGSCLCKILVDSPTDSEGWDGSYSFPCPQRQVWHPADSSVCWLSARMGRKYRARESLKNSKLPQTSSTTKKQISTRAPVST